MPTLSVLFSDSNRVTPRIWVANVKRSAHIDVVMIRILLAEDDTSMREYLQRALQRVGYDVEAVGCGTEAMPLIEPGKYDLLLTDIVMPEMDGIELAQKASAIDPAIRVMFITGFAAVALAGRPHRARGEIAVEAVPPQGPGRRSRPHVPDRGPARPALIGAASRRAAAFPLARFRRAA